MSFFSNPTRLSSNKKIARWCFFCSNCRRASQLHKSGTSCDWAPGLPQGKPHLCGCRGIAACRGRAPLLAIQRSGEQAGVRTRPAVHPFGNDAVHSLDAQVFLTWGATTHVAAHLKSAGLEHLDCITGRWGFYNSMSKKSHDPTKLESEKVTSCEGEKNRFSLVFQWKQHE